MAAKYLSRRDKLHLLDEHLIAIGYMTVRASMLEQMVTCSVDLRASWGPFPVKTLPTVTRPLTKRIPLNLLVDQVLGRGHVRAKHDPSRSGILQQHQCVSRSRDGVTVGSEFAIRANPQWVPVGAEKRPECRSVAKGRAGTAKGPPPATAPEGGSILDLLQSTGKVIIPVTVQEILEERIARKPV